MKDYSQNQALILADKLVADGAAAFTFEIAAMRLGKSKTATANVLKRMRNAGLIDRVRRGHYVVRPLGMLGTQAAAEDPALCVGAALKGGAHRIAYRSALEEHGLVARSAGSIQVASERPVRTRQLSGRPLKVVIESREKLLLGRVPRGMSYVSDRHRAVLDAAQRPGLVGGFRVLAEALAAAAPDLQAEILMDRARRLGWAPALRRLGSLADALALGPLAGKLAPVHPITADLDLEPGTGQRTVWRDSRWRVRWPLAVEDLSAAIRRQSIGRTARGAPRAAASGCRASGGDPT